MPRLFTPELASFYEGYYEGKGVTIIKGTSVTAFEKDDEGHVRSFFHRHDMWAAALHALVMNEDQLSCS